MAIYRSYFNKNNTLIKNKQNNTARNEVTELVYGSNPLDTDSVATRFIFDIDLTALNSKFASQEIISGSVISHVIKMKNTVNLRSDLAGQTTVYEMQRASGFELILFKIYEDWEEGTGREFIYDDLVSLSTPNLTASNWFTRKNGGINWNVPGIYSNQVPVRVIASQKFNIGIEDIEFDITDELNRDIFTGSTNNILFENYISPGTSSLILTTQSIGSVINFVVNGSTLVQNVDFTTSANQINLVNPIHLNDIASINYISNITGSTFNAFLLTTDNYTYTGGSAIFTLTQLLDTVLSVTLNGLTLTQNLDFTVGGNQIIFNFTPDNGGMLVIKYFKKFTESLIKSKGYGIAFSPFYEGIKTNRRQSVSFFSKYTNTFYEPFLETTYDSIISDNRMNFVLNQTNRLYLFSKINNKLINLDTIPTGVTIYDFNDNVYSIIPQSGITQQSKGVYYVELKINSRDYPDLVNFIDTWQGITYQGEQLADVEKEFTLYGDDFSVSEKDLYYQPTNLHFNFYGIAQDEKIKRGDVREVIVGIKKLYSKTQVEKILLNYRLFVKQGENQIDIIPITEVSKMENKYFFNLDTSFLIPNTYFLEISVKNDNLVNVKTDILKFKVISEK